MPNRTLCDVLREMRTCNEVRNYAVLLSLIEEAQIMGNRMEAALWDQGDIKRLRENKKEIKQEIADLREELNKLKQEKKEVSK